MYANLCNVSTIFILGENYFPFKKKGLNIMSLEDFTVVEIEFRDI